MAFHVPHIHKRDFKMTANNQPLRAARKAKYLGPIAKKQVKETK